MKFGFNWPKIFEHTHTYTYVNTYIQTDRQTDRQTLHFRLSHAYEITGYYCCESAIAIFLPFIFDLILPREKLSPGEYTVLYPIANTDIYKCSFFPQTFRDWNALPDSLISSAEGTEDGVAKFTSLVRARDYSLPGPGGERGGSVVECRTPEREVRGSKPTAAVLCP